MVDYREQLRYGLRLYPFALVMVLGLFISTTGPALLQSVLSGLSSVPFFRVMLIALILVTQLLGGVIAFAGFFGALHKVISDAKE